MLLTLDPLSAPFFNTSQVVSALKYLGITMTNSPILFQITFYPCKPDFKFNAVVWCKLPLSVVC